MLFIKKKLNIVDRLIIADQISLDQYSKKYIINNKQQKVGNIQNLISKIIITVNCKVNKYLKRKVSGIILLKTAQNHRKCTEEI